MNIIEIIETLRNFNEWRRYDGPIGEAPEQLSPKKIGEAIDGAVELLSKKSNTTIETIRAEIERRKNYLKPQGGQGLILCEEMRKQLDSLLSFLDTLQEKSEKPINPVCEDLEEEIERYIPTSLAVKFPTTDIETIKSDIRYIARHFAQWQKEQIIKRATTAIKERWYDKFDTTLLGGLIQLGMDKQKEQMMKEAVKGIAVINANAKEDGFGYVRSDYVSDDVLRGLKNFKLIIVKEG